MVLSDSNILKGLSNWLECFLKTRQKHFNLLKISSNQLKIIYHQVKTLMHLEKLSNVGSYHERENIRYIPSQHNTI